MTGLVPRTTALAEWAEEARATHQIAVSLSGTSFVPRAMQGRPDEVTGCILAGRELGMEPMAALRAIDIIDGTPSIRAVGLRGIVLAQGHKIWVDESTATRAVVCGQRRGEPTVQRSVWTMDRARTAGLATKKNWIAHPQSMLIARATAEVCRLIAADAIVGMPYTTEEIEDGVADTEAAPKRKATARRALPQVPEPELPAPGEAEQPEMVTEDGRPSVAARAGLFAALTAAGVTERPERLALIAQIIGRDVVTTNELTMGETRAIIAELAARTDALNRAQELADQEDPEDP